MKKVKDTENGLSLCYIIHPGNTLKEVLNDRNISKDELAISAGVSTKYISEIISGEKNISTNLAKKLKRALDIEASFWLNLQANYDKELQAYKRYHSNA